MKMRDSTGKFKELPDSLARKTIGLRVSKDRLPKMQRMAQETGLTLAELARQAVHQMIDAYKESSGKSAA